MRSGIRACCRLEKRASKHRAPSIDPAPGSANLTEEIQSWPNAQTHMPLLRMQQRKTLSDGPESSWPNGRRLAFDFLQRELFSFRDVTEVEVPADRIHADK
jgi:hypothetical protein